MTYYFYLENILIRAIKINIEKNLLTGKESLVPLDKTVSKVFSILFSICTVLRLEVSPFKRSKHNDQQSLTDTM